MRRGSSKVGVSLVAVAVLFATIGCVSTSPPLRVGELQTTSESVGLSDADSVRVDIFLAAGELDVGGGANELLEADFTFNVAELEPEVEMSGDTVSVRTPDLSADVDSWWDVDEYRYEWDLRLNDGVPMEMNVEMGAGRADLELGSLSLARLDVAAGAGEVTVDLSDSALLTRLDVVAGVGEVTVDLSGSWQDDLDATIKGGVGDFTLRLPSGVGVRVDVEGGLTDIDTRGMTRDGDAYVNSAYGESEVTLRIDLEAGLGNITLEVVD